MLADWDCLSENLQLLLSRMALARATEIIANQAEVLAAEIETGSMADFGGPDALRLLARIVRSSPRDTMEPTGMVN